MKQTRIATHRHRGRLRLGAVSPVFELAPEPREHRIVWQRRQRGSPSAAWRLSSVAVAASMLTAVYSTLRDDVEYRELGGQYFERLDRTKATQRLVTRLRDLGYRVHLEEVAA